MYTAATSTDCRQLLCVYCEQNGSNGEKLKQVNVDVQPVCAFMFCRFYFYNTRASLALSCCNVVITVGRNDFGGDGISLLCCRACLPPDTCRISLVNLYCRSQSRPSSGF